MAVADVQLVCALDSSSGGESDIMLCNDSNNKPRPIGMLRPTAELKQQAADMVRQLVLDFGLERYEAPEPYLRMLVTNAVLPAAAVPTGEPSESWAVLAWDELSNHGYLAPLVCECCPATCSCIRGLTCS